MYIQSINNVFNNNFKSNKIKNNNFQKQTTQKQINSLPTNVAFIPFMGGYSVDLGETYKRLDSSKYPTPVIEENIKNVLESGNVDNKTLCDVHFDYYKGINDCYTLQGLKEKYPEFSDVRDSYMVVPKEGSFVDRFQQGELDCFQFDEDLTLQLIKLYWGQGFSLNDLSDYVANHEKDGKGINLYYAMTKKLNIPLMNSQYASVLKLSNKEYNEQFTAQMGIKIAEAKEAKIQKAEGEPVIIPSRKLSEAHKQHISESLKKHYLEHPEDIYKMSERQKKFYQENPQKAEEFSQIMKYAWNETKEGKSLIQHISKYMRKKGAEMTPEEIVAQGSMLKANNQLFKDFWKINKWAGAELSKAMKKAYEIQAQKAKEEKFSINLENATVVNLIPNAFRQDIIRFAKERGMDISKYPISQILISAKGDKQNELSNSAVKKVDKIVDTYAKMNPRLANESTTVMLNAFIRLKDILNSDDSSKLPKTLRKDSGKLVAMQYAIRWIASTNDIYQEDEQGRIYPNPKEITIKTMDNVYSQLAQQAIFLNAKDFIELMNKQLEESYQSLLEAGVIKGVQPF